MNLTPLPADEYAEVAHLIRPFLENFAEHSGGRWTVPHLHQDILDRDKQCWAMVERGEVYAVALTQIVRYESGAEWARVIAGAGSEREKWQDMMQVFIESAKEQGFAGVEVYARPGWARVFGDTLKETHRVLEVKF